MNIGWTCACPIRVIINLGKSKKCGASTINTGDTNMKITLQFITEGFVLFTGSNKNRMKGMITVIALFLMINVMSGQNCQPALFKETGSPTFIGQLNGSLFFIAQQKIWKSNGTAAGTKIIAAAPNVPGDYKGFCIVGNHIYFSAYPPSSYTGRQLWRTDGSDAGTTLVKDIPDAENLMELTEAGGKIFFIHKKGSGWKNKLWKSDGTASGTELVLDIDPTNDINKVPKALIAFKNEVYFKAGNSVYGRELWKSNGTVEGTKPVKDINPGVGDGAAYNSVYAILNDVLYFEGGGGGNAPYGLYKTNGSDQGTVLVNSTCSQIGDLTSVNGKLYFSAYDNYGNSTFGEEIWTSDGTTAGTYMVKDVNPGINGSIYHLNAFVAVNGKILFAANDGSGGGTELWSTDGTPAGTSKLKEINTNTQYPIDGNPFLINAVMYNGYLYFTANDGKNGSELWKTNGTEVGTVMVKDILPGADSGSPGSFQLFNSNLFFYASHAKFETNLWYCGDSSLDIPTVSAEITSVYPNPAKETITINGIQIGAIIKIMDITGKMVGNYTSTNEQMTINIKDFTSGIYVLRIEHNGVIINRKLLVNN